MPGGEQVAVGRMGCPSVLLLLHGTKGGASQAPILLPEVCSRAAALWHG